MATRGAECQEFTSFGPFSFLERPIPNTKRSAFLENIAYLYASDGGFPYHTSDRRTLPATTSDATELNPQELS